MSSRSLPPSPEQSLVVGFGGICLDYLAVLPTFPKPDDKTRCSSMKIQGGGDAANTLTCLARLGVRARLISKISDDVHGKSLLEELRADGVDDSFLVVAKDGQTPFSYVIVDQSTRTRTCIFTPGFPLMEPADVSPGLTSAVKGARFVHFDARYADTAIVIAKEAARQNIPILLDAEKRRRGLDGLLDLSDYIVCSAKFPKAWTEAPSMPSALISMLLRLPKLKFAIVTLGEHGCLMLERSSEEDPLMDEEDADTLLQSLEQEKDDSVDPKCIPSVMCFSNRREKKLLLVLSLCLRPVTHARTAFRGELNHFHITTIGNEFWIIGSLSVKNWIMGLNLSANCIIQSEQAASNLISSVNLLPDILLTLFLKMLDILFL